MIAAAAGVHFGDHGAERRFGPGGRLETVPGDDQIRQKMRPLAWELLGRNDVSDHAAAVDSAQAAERLEDQVGVSRETPTSGLEHPFSFAAGEIEPDVAVVIGS